MKQVSSLKNIISSRLLGCIFLFVCCLFGCSQEEPVAQNRTIIIGFDGMDYTLTRQMMASGQLENFSKLAKTGYFGPLATTIPPQSPVAWSSFATGSSPGEHGIYDFLRRDISNYQPDFSIAQTIPPDSYLSLFGLKFPLKSGQVINRRQGETFWSKIEKQGQRASILRVPVTYPPEPVHRMLSGMGVPDLLGTQGTYSYYSTKPLDQPSNNGQLVHIRADRTGKINTVITGPKNPLKPDQPALTVPLTLKPDNLGVQINIAKHNLTLNEGEWSDWIQLSFPFFLWSGIDGMVRFHLIESYPEVKLYVTPIHIDPTTPAVPISSPQSFASDLVEKTGLFHTIGMPEETWSLNARHLSDSGFLDVIKTTLQEREAMFFDTLEQQDSELVISVFVQTDRVSHMFYRGIDPQHLLHDPDDELVNGAIAWIYQEADRILGKTMSQLKPNDQLIVLSDHGFAPFRRAVNLNRWLMDEGYQVLHKNKPAQVSSINHVDWSQTQAYAMGLNGLYLNLKGREPEGIVDTKHADHLLQEISNKLTLLTDPSNNKPMVKTVYHGKMVYPSNRNQDAPDLVVGYHSGYRASWQTALGAAGTDLVHDNLDKWSGDHCIAADEVPGIVLFSHPHAQYPVSIEEISNYVHRPQIQ